VLSSSSLRPPGGGDLLGFVRAEGRRAADEGSCFFFCWLYEVAVSSSGELKRGVVSLLSSWRETRRRLRAGAGRGEASPDSKPDMLGELVGGLLQIDGFRGGRLQESKTGSWIEERSW
jgi:hypothetical protein